MKKSNELHPSSAHQWFKCPGSLSLYAGKNHLFQNDVFAQKGRIIHSMAERYFNPEGTDELSAVDMAFYNENKLECDVLCQFIIDTVEDFLKGLPKNRKLFWEHTMTLKFPPYVINGTPDLLVLTNDELIVVDYKTGSKQVDAFENVQLSIYAYLFCVLNKIEVKKIKRFGSVIIQPAHGAFRESDLVHPYLIAEEFKKLAAMKKLKFCAGPHCTYCDVSDICKEFRKYLKMFLAPDVVDAYSNRLEEWPKLLELCDPIITNLTRMKETIKTSMENGVKVEGYRLGKGIAKRFFVTSNPAFVAKTLGLKKKDVIVESLKTPAAIEKLLPKDKRIKLADLVGKNPPTIIEKDVNIFER